MQNIFFNNLYDSQKANYIFCYGLTGPSVAQVGSSPYQICQRFKKNKKKRSLRGFSVSVTSVSLKQLLPAYLYLLLWSSESIRWCCKLTELQTE